MVRVNVHTQEDHEPRIEWFDGFASVEIQPGVFIYVSSVEQAERLRDTFAALVDGFTARALDWLAQVQEEDRAAEEVE